MEKLAVRAAQSADLDALADITAELQALHVEQRPDHFRAVDRQSLERWSSDLLSNPQGMVWVAELNGEVVGSVVVSRPQRPDAPFHVPGAAWWLIDQIGVLASHRRRGVGRAMALHVIGEAQKQGITQIQLNSWAFNQTAHAAFRSFGFAPRFIRFELPVGAARPEAAT